MTHNDEGGADCPSWVSFFPLGSLFPTERGIRGLEETSPWSTLAWGRDNMVKNAAAFLILLMQCVLVSEVQGVLQPHPCVIEFSQCCLVLE